MTLIVGLNLSDRIYLAADTRATNRNTGKHSDDIFKIAPIAPPKNSDGSFGTDHIYLAVAGSIDLARFFYLCINKRIQEGRFKYDIRSLYESLDDKWCSEMQAYWDKATMRDNICCSLIIGGVSPINKRPFRKSTLTK